MKVICEGKLCVPSWTKLSTFVTISFIFFKRKSQSHDIGGVFFQRLIMFYCFFFSFVPMCNLWPCKCMGVVWFKRHWKVFPWSNRNWSLPSSREMCFDALKIKMEIMLSKNVLKLWNLPVFSSSLNHLEARYVKI